MCIICGIFVIITKNPVESVLFLIGLFLAIASYLMIIGVSFIGLSYLLVYIGAVSILFLFILMLINVRVSELSSDTSNSLPLSMLIGIVFYIIIFNGLESTDINKFTYANGYNYSVNYDTSFVLSQEWDTNLGELSHITSIGNVMYTTYPVWLILTSLILLLAMVGAIVITLKESKI